MTLTSPRGSFVYFIFALIDGFSLSPVARADIPGFTHALIGSHLVSGANVDSAHPRVFPWRIRGQHLDSSKSGLRKQISPC